MTILFHCHSDGIEAAAIFLVDQGGARHQDTHPQGSFLSWETQASSSPRSSASQGLGSLPIQKTCSPGTHEAQRALRARGTGLGSARLNIPTSATSRMVREMEVRGPGVRPGQGRGSLRHAHLLPCLRVTGAGISQLASSHRPSICHDTPGKNTVKYCFFIPFITRTRLNLEAPLALNGKVQPWPWCPACPQHKHAHCGAPGPGGPGLLRRDDGDGRNGAKG